MGGHNRAEARARSSGEHAGRAFGRQAAPDGAKRQRAVFGGRGKSECEALPTPYSRNDGVLPAAKTPRAHTVERRERHCRKPIDDGLKRLKVTLGGYSENRTGFSGFRMAKARKHVILKTMAVEKF